MSSAIRNINLIIAAAGLTLSTVSLFQAGMNRFMEKGTKKFFVTFFALFDAYVICIFGERDHA